MRITSLRSLTGRCPRAMYRSQPDARRARFGARGLPDTAIASMFWELTQDEWLAMQARTSG